MPLVTLSAKVPSETKEAYERLRDQKNAAGRTPPAKLSTVVSEALQDYLKVSRFDDDGLVGCDGCGVRGEHRSSEDDVYLCRSCCPPLYGSRLEVPA